MLRADQKRILCLLLCLFLALGLAGCQADAPELSLTVLDVGQSDCIFLEIGEMTVLVDAGTASSRAAVSAFLKARGVRSLDYLVLTHLHEDHIGNARMVIEQFGVKNLLLPNGESEDFGYELILSAAQRCNTVLDYVASDRKLSLGGAQCDILVPEDESQSNASLVLRFSLDGIVILLMGDAEKEQEQALLAKYSADFLDCDLLKVGHHGSKTSSSLAFLQAASPSFAAISCGKDNDFGFPHTEVLQRFSDLGITVCRTDLSGDLTFEIANGTLQRKEG